MTCNSPIMNESKPLQTLTKCLQTSKPLRCSNGAELMEAIFSTVDSNWLLSTPKPTNRTRLQVDISKTSASRESLIFRTYDSRSSFDSPSDVKCLTESTLLWSIFIEIMLTPFISSLESTLRPLIS